MAGPPTGSLPSGSGIAAGWAPSAAPLPGASPGTRGPAVNPYTGLTLQQQEQLQAQMRLQDPRPAGAGAMSDDDPMSWMSAWCSCKPRGDATGGNSPGMRAATVLSSPILPPGQPLPPPGMDAVPAAPTHVAAQPPANNASPASATPGELPWRQRLSAKLPWGRTDASKASATPPPSAPGPSQPPATTQAGGVMMPTHLMTGPVGPGAPQPASAAPLPTAQYYAPSPVGASSGVIMQPPPDAAAGMAQAHLLPAVNGQNNPQQLQQQQVTAYYGQQVVQPVPNAGYGLAAETGARPAPPPPPPAASFGLAMEIAPQQTGHTLAATPVMQAQPAAGAGIPNPAAAGAGGFGLSAELAPAGPQLQAGRISSAAPSGVGVRGVPTSTGTPPIALGAAGGGFGLAQETGPASTDSLTVPQTAAPAAGVAHWEPNQKLGDGRSASPTASVSGPRILPRVGSKESDDEAEYAAQRRAMKASAAAASTASLQGGGGAGVSSSISKPPLVASDAIRNISSTASKGGGKQGSVGPHNG